MHEMSIAMNLVDVAVEQAIENEASKVTLVEVEVGDLSGVVPAALRSAFKVASAKEELLKSAKLKIVRVAVALVCSHCDDEHPAMAANDLRCSVCQQPSGDVVRGRELDVVAIEIE